MKNSICLNQSCFCIVRHDAKYTTDRFILNVLTNTSVTMTFYIESLLSGCSLRGKVQSSTVKLILSLNIKIMKTIIIHFSQRAATK